MEKKKRDGRILLSATRRVHFRPHWVMKKSKGGGRQPFVRVAEKKKRRKRSEKGEGPSRLLEQKYEKKKGRSAHTYLLPAKGGTLPLQSRGKRGGGKKEEYLKKIKRPQDWAQRSTRLEGKGVRRT